MKTRIWKETATGRAVPGTLREIDVPVNYAGSAELECFPPKTLKPYASQGRPIYVQAKRRQKPMKRKAGNA